MPSDGQLTSKVGHSEVQKVCQLISTDKLCALVLTSVQWSRVKLRGVVTVCPIVKVTSNSKQRLKTHRQKLTNTCLHLDRQDHSGKTDSQEDYCVFTSTLSAGRAGLFSSSRRITKSSPAPRREPPRHPSSPPGTSPRAAQSVSPWHVYQFTLPVSTRDVSLHLYLRHE